jgi:predicted RNA-binding protein with PUA-like domain
MLGKIQGFGRTYLREQSPTDDTAAAVRVRSDSIKSLGFLGSTTPQKPRTARLLKGVLMLSVVLKIFPPGKKFPSNRTRARCKVAVYPPRPNLRPMSPQFWLVKSEPDAYAWSQLVADGRTAWTGVRNFQARNHLRAMRTGDLVLYYHSVTGKEVVGLAKVAKEAYPDPTAKEGDWSCIDIVPFKPFTKPVSLDQIKAEPALAEIKLLRQSRLSVMPVTKGEFDRLLKLGGTKV